MRYKDTGNIKKKMEGTSFMLDARKKRVPHGWRLIRNYGNYGAYGWALGLWHSTVLEADGLATSDLIIQVGPYKVMFARVTT